MMSDCSTNAFKTPEVSLKKLAKSQGGPPWMLEIDDMYGTLPEAAADMVTAIRWRGKVYVLVEGA